MKYLLDNIDNLSQEQIQSKIDKGSKFVVFNYRISLGLVSLLRFSPAILVQNKNDFNYYKNKYNRINFLCGPWLLFSGPYLTYKIYKHNKNGGIDVTQDILINLTENAINNKEVEILYIHSVYDKVSLSEKKTITKAILKIKQRIVNIEALYLGLYVNVSGNEKPYYTIGIQSKKEDITTETEIIKEQLYKYFYKHIPFYFVKIGHNDTSKLIIEQCELIYKN